MADRFVEDDKTYATAMVQEDEGMTTTTTTNPNKKVTFRMAVPTSHENMENLDRLNQLELTVHDLKQKLAAMHELLSRAIETNLMLKNARVPTYEPETVQAAATAAGIENSAASGGGGAGTTITLVRASGNKLVLKGKTFDVKDELKRKFAAQWDAGLKCWSCADSFEPDVRSFLTERGFNIA
jgi:mevalonate kinase